MEREEDYWRGKGKETSLERKAMRLWKLGLEIEALGGVMWTLGKAMKRLRLQGLSCGRG